MQVICIEYYGTVYFDICSLWLTGRNIIGNYRNIKVKQLHLQQITKQHIPLCIHKYGIYHLWSI